MIGGTDSNGSWVALPKLCYCAGAPIKKWCLVLESINVGNWIPAVMALEQLGKVGRFGIAYPSGQMAYAVHLAGFQHLFGFLQPPYLNELIRSAVRQPFYLAVELPFAHEQLHSKLLNVERWGGYALPYYPSDFRKPCGILGGHICRATLFT